MPAGLDGVM